MLVQVQNSLVVRKFVGYVTLTRFYMAMIVGVSAVCGGRLSASTTRLSDEIAIFTAECLIAAAGLTLNDLLDFKRDAGVLCKPLPTGRLSHREAVYTFCILLGGGLAFSAILGLPPFLLAGIQVLAVAIYSWAKTWSGAISNLITAVLSASGFVFGAIVNLQLGSAWVPAVLTVEIILAREIVKDVLDLKPDFASNIPTIPVKYGLPTAAVMVVILVILTITTCWLPLTRSHFGTGYGIMMAGVNVALIIATGLFLANQNRRGAGLFLHITALAFPLALAACLT